MNSQNSHTNEHTESAGEHYEKPGLWAVIVSVLAAMFGVQTEANRRRDFSSGNPLAYIIVFVVFLLLFVLTIAGIVALVISISR